MRILLTGGSACGKSTYAESLALRLGAPRVYLAAMRPYGAESLQRIARHRQLRDGKGFVTIERDCNVGALMLPAHATVLLECMCNLLANEMFDASGYIQDVEEKLLLDVAKLESKCDHLIVVTNDVGSDIACYDAGTNAYIKALGRINCAMAARFDCVLELVAGIPLVLKGELP